MTKQAIGLSESLEENTTLIRAKLGDSSDIRCKDFVNQGYRFSIIYRWNC